jgi:hypothetical protein
LLTVHNTFHLSLLLSFNQTFDKMNNLLVYELSQLNKYINNLLYNKYDSSPILNFAVTQSWDKSIMNFFIQQQHLIFMNIDVLKGIKHPIRWVLLLEPCDYFHPIYNAGIDAQNVLKCHTIEDVKTFLTNHKGIILYSFLQGAQSSQNYMELRYLQKLYIPIINPILACLIQASNDSLIFTMNKKTLENVKQIYKRCIEYKHYLLCNFK